MRQLTLPDQINSQMKHDPDTIHLAVAIDGPAGSGKSTTAREVARRLGYQHVDTGAMYRAVTWKALDSDTDVNDSMAVGRLAYEIDIMFVNDDGSPKQVLVDGVDVTDAIRSAEVTRNVSVVSSHPAVRAAMVRIQRRLARRGNVVLEGRDIGTVVLPSAEVKIYLDASSNERARRRLKEMEAKGSTSSIEDVRADIERRDSYDSSRETSPLRIPVGARVVDTTALTIDEQVNAVVATVERVRGRLAAARVAPGGQNPVTREKPFYRFVRLAAWFTARLVFGLRVIDEDRDDYAEAYLYAANHRSNGDPPVVAAARERELAFLAKESLFDVPLLGPLIRKLNSIPTARERFDRKAVRVALKWLQEGGSLLMFPEGQRSRSLELGEAKAGVGYLALRSGRPVVPVFISGTEDLWGALFRQKKLTVAFGRPMRLTDPENTGTSSESCHEFGKMVMAALAALQDEIEPGPRAG
ncbi:MAG: (d)CMP kinase [Candidatus Latescibacterota bacterium]|nr:MAG: (d)CMP kinase [Candidatus Latescibacterota bacterium]